MGDTPKKLDSDSDEELPPSGVTPGVDHKKAYEAWKKRNNGKRSSTTTPPIDLSNK